MRRRFRRNRGTWLPIDPTVLSQDDNAPGLTVFQTVETTPDDIGRITNATIVPVAFDKTRQTPNNNQTAGLDDLTMRDLTEGQDYFLDRAVGKIWATLEASSPTNFVSQCLFCAALAVIQVQDDGITPALDNASLHPLLAQNVMAPYIWRRTWVLYDLGGSNEAFGVKPSTIAQYGSVMDGGHIDAKTKRRIAQNQRLVMITAMCTLEVVGAPGTLSEISWGFDLRLHGALRRNKNRSLFT